LAKYAQIKEIISWGIVSLKHPRKKGGYSGETGDGTVNGQTNPSRRIGNVVAIVDRSGPGAFSLMGRTQALSGRDNTCCTATGSVLMTMKRAATGTMSWTSVSGKQINITIRRTLSGRQ